MSVHFFTGFPGFITSQIIREAFQKGVCDEVLAVVHVTQIEKAQNEASKILEEFPDKKIRLYEGDITLPNLGLDEKCVKDIATQVEVLWHLAAIYDLAVPREIAWKVNVHGTEMVNDFVLNLPNLKRYMYFSTAYVAGRREGVLYESELIRPEAFKNYYEETKFEAELLVEDLKAKVPLTIIRPGVVRGHSETGETIKFDGPYFFMNMVERLKHLPVIPYVGKSTARFNTVPVDYITKGAVFIANESSAIGKTFHLTDPNPHPVQEIYRHMVKLITNRYPKGRLPLGMAKVSLSIPFVRKALGVEMETIDYLTWNAHFDVSDAVEVLKKGGIECPDFLKTMPQMVEFFLQHKDDQLYQIEIK